MVCEELLHKSTENKTSDSDFIDKQKRYKFFLIFVVKGGGMTICLSSYKIKYMFLNSQRVRVFYVMGGEARGD